MTCRERLEIEYPEKIDVKFCGGCMGCPCIYGYLPKPETCNPVDAWDEISCTACWDREIPDLPIEEYEEATDIPKELVEEFNKVPEQYVATTDEIKKVIGVDLAGPRILDSGARREFETGAVRDIQEGKGRCDLLPLDVAHRYLNYVDIGDKALSNIYAFQEDADVGHLFDAIDNFVDFRYRSVCTMLLEVSKHFEEGCKKYGDNNWRKGIPVRCYIDSAVRHYLKFLRGDKDEPHDRAFIWNIMCAIWTCEHLPELNEYRREDA